MRTRSNPVVFQVEWRNQEGGSWQDIDHASDLRGAKNIAVDYARQRIDGDLVAIRSSTKKYPVWMYLVQDGQVITPRSAREIFLPASDRFGYEDGWIKMPCADIIQLAALWPFPWTTVLMVLLECLQETTILRDRVSSGMSTGLELLFGLLRREVTVDAVRKFWDSSKRTDRADAGMLALYQMIFMMTRQGYPTSSRTYQATMSRIANEYDCDGNLLPQLEDKCRQLLDKRISLGALLLAGSKVMFSKTLPQRVRIT